VRRPMIAWMLFKDDYLKKLLATDKIKKYMEGDVR